jgi:hypothetical protein
MDSAKLNDWMQVFGIFALVGSLVFVGLQMKQDRQIALSAAMQAKTDTTIQNIMGQASNPYYMSAVDKIETGDYASLLPSEKQAVHLLSNAMLLNFENYQYQYQNGYLPEERWKGTRNALKRNLQSSVGLRQLYESNPAVWGGRFKMW